MLSGAKSDMSVSKRARQYDTLMTVTQWNTSKSLETKCVKILVCQVAPDTLKLSKIKQLFLVCQCVYIYREVTLTHSQYIAAKLLLVGWWL